MENQILDVLENRIIMAIDTISKLREENQQLKEDKTELLNRIQDQEKNIERLRRRCDEFDKNENHNEELIEKIGHARERIKSLIIKLDELEPLP